MTNILNFKQRTRPGDNAFMLCDCGSEKGFAAVILADANPDPLIVALVCVDCGRELTVVNGRVDAREPSKERP